MTQRGQIGFEFGQGRHYSTDAAWAGRHNSTVTEFGLAGQTLCVLLLEALFVSRADFNSVVFIRRGETLSITNILYLEQLRSVLITLEIREVKLRS